MFSVEEATRRATLKAIGFIQIFLGCTALFGTIAAMVVRVSADSTFSGIWSSVFYILLGMLAVQCARLDIVAPSRRNLLACIILNSIIAVLSILGVALLLLAVTAINNASSGDNDTCQESVMTIMKALLGISIINLLAAVPVSVTAALLATKIKNAAVAMTLTTSTQGALYAVPHTGGPVLSSGYSVVPVGPPSYDSTTHNVGPGYVVHVK